MRMGKPQGAIAFGIACAILISMADNSSAHHSTAMFAWGESTEMDGATVERWVWTNPHTFLYVRDSQGNRWAFEGMSPNHLARAGWSRRSLAPGERVSLTYYRLRDGRRGGFNVAVTKGDGSMLSQFSNRD